MLQELPGDFIRDRAALWKNNSPFPLVSHSGPTLPLKVVSVPRLEAKHEANHSEACRLCSPVRMPLCGWQQSLRSHDVTAQPQLPHQRVGHRNTYFSFISRHQISNSMESPCRRDRRNTLQLLKVIWLVIIQSQEYWRLQINKKEKNNLETAAFLKSWIMLSIQYFCLIFLINISWNFPSNWKLQRGGGDKGRKIKRDWFLFSFVVQGIISRLRVHHESTSQLL